MDDELSPEAARSSLAQVERMQRRGFQRGQWPRWARAVETLGIVTVSALLGFPALYPVAVVLAFAGVAFRYWGVFRFGAFRFGEWQRWVPLMATFGLATYVRFSGVSPWLAVAGAIAAAAFVLLWDAKRRREMGRQ